MSTNATVRRAQAQPGVVRKRVPRSSRAAPKGNALETALDPAMPISVPGLDALTLEELAVLSAEDHADAWNELYARAWPFALKVAEQYGRRRGWSEDDAIDWAQDAMVRAWKYRKKYRPPASYEAWIRAIVYNRILTDMNQASGRADALQQGNAFVDNDEAGYGEGLWRGSAPATPDQEAEEGMCREWLERLLQQLPTRERELLTLYAEDRHYEFQEEDGAVLSRAGIRTRVHRAVKKLKEMAEDAPPIDF